MNTGVGAALAGLGFKDLAPIEDIRRALSPAEDIKPAEQPPEAPVNAQESPVARPDAQSDTTTPETPQDEPQAPGSTQGTPSVAQVTVPTVDDLHRAVSEGRFDDARDIALQMERAAKAPEIDTSNETDQTTVEQPNATTTRPDTGSVQAGESQAGQPDAAQVQPASVGQPRSSDASGETGQTAGTSNRQNVETYGEGEVPSGQGADTVQLLDNARADIRSGAVNPYSVLSKTRARGIANPEEYAALAAEHERLVNDAVAKQKANSPDAPEAVRAATDFANAIQPHKTAASDVFRLMQGDLNYDMSTPFGMNEYMKAEIGRGMKPSETPKFTRMANDIRGAEAEVPKAVERSDARVRTKYAKVADIPMEAAAARVKEFLKDCV